MIRVPRLRALARPIGREARAFLAAALLAAFVASALPFLGPTVVAVAIGPTALGAVRALLGALRTILVAPAAVPPGVAVPPAVLWAPLPALFLASSAFVVTFHVAISFFVTGG